MTESPSHARGPRVVAMSTQSRVAMMMVEQPGGITPQGSLLVVYSLVVLYALCYQLQSPIEPFLVDKLLNSTGKGAATASESAVA